jgi:hypothetical protein
VFPSPYDPAIAFVSKNGFRNDDFAPYLYRTSDYGRTWTPIIGNLPQAPINVVVQDRKNRDLLFVGNDLGVFVSVDGGRGWSRLKANLPTVPVHDLKVHPRENDLVLGTYGRAFWVGDITPLQEMTPAVASEPVHVFDIEPRARYGFGSQGMNYNLFGDAFIEVPDEPDALVVNYLLNSDAGNASITVTDRGGTTVRQLTAPAKAGFNRVLVPLAGGGRGRGGRGGRGRGAAPSTPLDVGDYSVTIDVAGQKITKRATVRARL